MRKVVHTDGAPQAIGPYSQGITAGGWLFCAGQLGLDPASGTLMPGGAAAEAEQAFRNLQAVAETAGGRLPKAVRVIVYLADMADFAAVNEVMARFFPVDPPARATVQVARLPRDARVEIEATIWLG